MAQQNAAKRRRWALITSVITLGLIGLAQQGCDSSSSGPPVAPVVVESVSP